MNVRFLSEVFCCVFVSVCLAGVVSARDCSGCGGGCKGVAGSTGNCTPTNNGTCKNVNSGTCESGCSCNSAGVVYGACVCS